MKTLLGRFRVLVAFLLLVLSGRARAETNPMQGQRSLPMMGAEFRFVPGTWGTYRLLDKAAGQENMMYFAVLEEVRQRKGKAYWMEIEVVSTNNPVVVTRLLVPDTGEGPGEAQKAYVQISGYRPFEVPKKYLKPSKQKSQEQVGQFERYEPAGEPKGKTIKWKGRSLDAVIVDAKDPQGQPVTVTVSEATPPLCIVNMEAPSVTMELLDWGTGARTKIQGKPVGMWRWIFGVTMQAAGEASSGK